MTRARNLTELKYEDLQVSVGRVSFPGVSDPTWRAYDHGIVGGVAFDVMGFAVGDRIDFDVQTFHAMKLSTVLNEHLHFILPDTTSIGDKFQFQLDVIAAAVNTQFAVPAGSPFVTEHTIAANDNTFHRLMSLADIPAINTTVSTIYTCRLTRIAATSNEYIGEVYVKYIDGHCLIDDRGSQQETVK